MSRSPKEAGVSAGTETATGAQPLRLTLFGGFTLNGPGGEEVAITLRKGQGLLAYLALAQGQSASREHLAGVFWGGSTQQNARQSLRQLLFSLTRDLATSSSARGDPAEQPLSPLVVDSQSVSLRPGGIAVDVVQYRALAEAGDAPSLDAALRLYTGELLEGCAINSEVFEVWLNAERQQLADTARTSVRSVIAHRRAQGQHYQAIAVCQTGLRLDPLNEELHRALMELYIDNAMHSSALAQYRYCLGLLRSELGVEPDRETRLLYERILSRSDHKDGAAETPEAEQPPSGEEQATALFLERGPLVSALLARLLGGDAGAEHTLLHGARGFGKSELLKRVGAQIEDRGGRRVLRLHGCVQEQDLSLAPWMEVVGALSRRSRDARREERGDGRGEQSAMAELRRLMDASIDAEPEDTQPPHRIARALESVLVELGERQPTVLLVDDAQALDPASLWLLGYCLRRAEVLNLRVLAAWNGEGAAGDLREILAPRTPEVEVLELPGLSARAVRSIVNTTLRNLGKALRPHVAPEIEAMAEGNPMVAKELAWSVLKTSGSGNGGLRAPAQVQRHLAERLAPLRPESRRILDVLAIAAVPMGEADLNRVLTLRADRLAAGLRDLDAAALIEAEGGGGRFRVRREYERRAVVEAMTSVARTAVHKRMIAMIKEGGVEDEQSSLRLATHHEGAGESGCAVDAILAAARLARGRGAYREARHHLQKAELAMTGIQPRSAARTALLAEIQLQHARLAELAQDDVKAAECLAAAGEEVELLPSSVLYRLLTARARNAAACGDGTDARRQFRHAFMLAARHGRPIRPRAADRLLNQLHLIECTPDAYARRLEETARNLNGRRQRLAACEVTGALALLLAAGGRFEAAGEKIAAALKLADEMGDEVLLAAALQWCGMIALWRGDWAAADEDLLRSAKIAESRGDLLRSQMANTLRANALAHAGELTAAAACLEQAQRLAEELDDVEGRALAAVVSAELSIERGEPEQARAALERVLGGRGGLNRPWTLALGRRALARALLDDPAGSPVEAERAARHAVAEQEALGLKVEAARSLVVQARGFRAGGKGAQAVETYREASRRLASMGLEREAVEAETLAAALSVDASYV